MRPDKSYRLGVERLVTIFRGEMMTLGFDDDEIIQIVMEVCNPTCLLLYEETKQQLDHLKEISNA